MLFVSKVEEKLFQDSIDQNQLQNSLKTTIKIYDQKCFQNKSKICMDLKDLFKDL